MDPIVITVSYRSDRTSALIANELYRPVVCGADYGYLDRRLQGDNTGVNISKKKPYYSEFTVQYWNWKNLNATYRGLCHYRRFLAFQGKGRRGNGQIYHPTLNLRAVRRFGLDNVQAMRSIIESHDVVSSIPQDIRRCPTPKGIRETVIGHWEGYENVLVTREMLAAVLPMIKAHFPQYASAAASYLNGHYYRGYNCYIMRDSLFDEMCRFQFELMEKMEHYIDFSRLTGNMMRGPAYFGEILYGIFMHYLQSCGRRSFAELPLVIFENTAVSHGLSGAARCAAAAFRVRTAGLSDWLLPKGSRRREHVKKIWNRIK